MLKREVRQIVDECKGKSIIGLDCFDTLLQRVHAPIYPFIILAKTINREYNVGCHIDLLTFANSLSCFFNSKLELNRSILMLYHHYRMDSIVEPSVFVSLVHSTLLEAEKRNVTAAPNAGLLLHKLRAAKKKIWVCSDYHLGMLDVAALLNQEFGSDMFDRIAVSCDMGFLKEDPRFWQTIGATPANFFMVGDNWKSDFKTPSSLAISCHHIDSTKAYSAYSHFVLKYELSREKALERLISKDWISYSSNSVFLLYHFCEELYKCLLGGECVYFLSREGQLLQRLFDSYLLEFDKKGIKTKYLYVSRLACYLAQIDVSEGPISLVDNVLTYLEGDVKTISAFLVILGFTQSDISRFSQLSGFDFFAPSSQEGLKKCISCLWELGEFKERLVEKIGLSKAAFLEEMAPISNGRLILVDVGFRGTMQDYLRSFLPSSIDLQGYYVLLSTPQNESNNSHKKALISEYWSNPSYAADRRYLLNLEIVLRADHGQVIRCLGKGNAMFRNDLGLRVYRDYSAGVQKIIKKRFQELLEIDRQTPISQEVFCSIEEKVVLGKGYISRDIERWFFHYDWHGCEQYRVTPWRIAKNCIRKVQRAIECCLRR